MEETTIIPHSAHTVMINTKEHSYGIFCFNDYGDLFLDSDWGFFGYAWRSYVGEFSEFLSKTNADYVTGKLEINYQQNQPRGQGMKPHQFKHVHALVEEFLRFMKQYVASQQAAQMPESAIDHGPVER